jgi:rhodanese-related sulfurtransferase
VERPLDALEVTPQETADALAAGTAQVVDVREPYEREAGHIAGTRHVPVGGLREAAATLDPDAPVIFVCRVGGRSLMAAQAFRRAGFDARSMAGGLERWDAEGRALSPEGAYVAPH